MQSANDPTGVTNQRLEETSSMEQLIGELLAEIDDDLKKVELGRSSFILPRMLLTALEREQVAAIAYSEDMMTERIEALPVDEATREVVKRIALWVHRDEMLHTQYIRGLLLQTALPLSSTLPLPPPPVVLVRQLVGSVGGWVSAVSQSHSQESFGLRGFVARSAIKAGQALGRLPDALSDELVYKGFRRFCEFNVALEESAVYSYERLLPHLPASEVENFDRIIIDERRHAAVFRILVESFDETDRLRPGVTAETIIERVASVSPWFLPGRFRAAYAPTGHPVGAGFGQGSVVNVQRGQGSEDLRRCAIEAWRATGLEQLVRDRGGSVVIRGSFMLGYDRRDPSNYVSPELIGLLAETLRSWGADDVVLSETSRVYDHFFQNRSVAEVAAYLGFDSPHYRVVDAELDRRTVRYERGLVTAGISASWADADLRIVACKLRGDPTEMAQLCLSSLAGIAGRIDSQVHTDRKVDYRTATLMALDIAPPDYAMVDAWGPVADGPVGVMGCSRPSTQYRIYAGSDALSVDAAVLRDMGFADPMTSQFIKQADQWFGKLNKPVRVDGSPGALVGFRAPQGSLWYRLVSATAAPIYFNLSGRGTLFVPAMDPEAFPPIGNPPAWLRTVRRVVQRVFGLHPPGVKP